MACTVKAQPRIDRVIKQINDQIDDDKDERHQAQVAFIEKQNQSFVELERKWREAEAKFSVIEQTASSITGEVHALEEIMRSVRKTKEQLDESSQRIDRRVNEITEMHRLNEDHFRQEWTVFKAEDHKRWANYTLVQEELQKDEIRQYEKLEERLVQLEDLSQQVSDHFEELNEETQKRLRSLLNIAHSWVSSYERTFGKTSDSD